MTRLSELAITLVPRPTTRKNLVACLVDCVVNAFVDLNEWETRLKTRHERAAVHWFLVQGARVFPMLPVEESVSHEKFERFKAIGLAYTNLDLMKRVSNVCTVLVRY